MKIVALFGFFFLSLIPAIAQDAAPYELSAGYNLRVFTRPNYSRVGLSGAYVSGNYNIFSRISVAADISSSYRDQGVNGNLSIYSAMIGPQIYPFKHRHKITPFGHVLIGDGYYRINYPAFGGFPAQVTSYSGLTWEAGGGVDITHSKRWAIRLIQLDYGQTKFLGPSSSQNNIRASIGLIYRFGIK